MEKSYLLRVWSEDLVCEQVVIVLTEEYAKGLLTRSKAAKRMKEEFPDSESLAFTDAHPVFLKVRKNIDLSKFGVGEEEGQLAQDFSDSGCVELPPMFTLGVVDKWRLDDTEADTLHIDESSMWWTCYTDFGEFSTEVFPVEVVRAFVRSIIENTNEEANHERQEAEYETDDEENSGTFGTRQGATRPLPHSSASRAKGARAG